MAFDTTPITQDGIILKTHYDRLMANTVENRYLSRGYFGLSLSNYGNSLEPQIIGRVEVSGEIVVFNSLTSITGWGVIPNSTDVYIIATNATSAQFVSTVPTWDDTKQGWYVGSNRAVFKLRKDSSGLYVDKRAMSQEKIIDTEQIRDRAVTSFKLDVAAFSGIIPVGGLLLAAFDGRPGSPGPYGVGVPTNYLYCDGSSLIRVNFPDLYNAIKTIYGEGLTPGTTFALPDYRGKFFRVQADSQSADPDRAARLNYSELFVYNRLVVVGDQIGSFQWHSMQYHRHGVSIFHDCNRDDDNSNNGDNNRAEHRGTVNIFIIDPIDSPLAIPVRLSSETRPTNVYIQAFIRYI
jgi:hypothetical protein